MLFKLFKKRNKVNNDNERTQDIFQPRDVFNEYYEYSEEKGYSIPKKREYLFGDLGVDYTIHRFDQEFDENCHLLYFNSSSCRDVHDAQWVYIQIKNTVNEVVFFTLHIDNSIENGTSVSRKKRIIPNEVLIGNDVFDSISYGDSVVDNIIKFIDIYFKVKIDPQIIGRYEDVINEMVKRA